MNIAYRYTFEKGSRKHFCPNCNKKTFVRYIDSDTGDYLPLHYGRCDRDNKCGYYSNPYKDGYKPEQAITNRMSNPPNMSAKHLSMQTLSRPIFFDMETFRQTLDREQYSKNNFINNLLKSKYPFPDSDVKAITELYRLGTVARGYRSGSTTFPFIDINGNVRAVQVKNFDNKNRTVSTDFLHSIIQKYYEQKGRHLPQWLKAYNMQDKRVTCLFGEHLLREFPLNPVALVEAPKTAIYGTLYFGLPESDDDYIWLAVYNRSSFSAEKLKVLRGRKISVFPDLSKDGSCYNEWMEKSNAITRQFPDTQFKFSDLLEHFAPVEDRIEGYDLADYLMQHDWRLFRGGST